MIKHAYTFESAKVGINQIHNLYRFKMVSFCLESLPLDGDDHSAADESSIYIGKHASLSQHGALLLKFLCPRKSHAVISIVLS